ncbi:hypothetical protein OHT57_19820 [Streptomyces sp. NBC_00285]|uniref:hypothetical protein n=1 Tax=Streptomyces sp. NBC_00285 TaxID=2975700 RepID=UPI002E2D8652|nr:hypothetical protein [Streptomyces sp. NBC_00285]
MTGHPQLVRSLVLAEADPNPEFPGVIAGRLDGWPEPIEGSEQGEVEYELLRTDWEQRRRGAS